MVVSKLPLAFSCVPENDLYGVLASNGHRFPRFDSPNEALDDVPRGGGLLIMADGYPGRTTKVDGEILASAAQ